MDPIVSAAEQILRQDPAPGLPLADLTDHLRRHMDDGRLTPEGVRTRLESEPGLFRVLDLHPGPLEGLSALEELGASRAWVAVLGDPASADPTPHSPGLSQRVRDSVRWMAGRVDDRSSRDVARWRRLLVAEARTREQLDSAS